MTPRAIERVRRNAAIIALTLLAIGAESNFASITVGAATSPASLVAQQLLSQAITPPAAVLAHPTSTVVCQCEGPPAMGTVTTDHHYYIVRGPPTALEKFLTTHLPKGGSYNGSTDTTNASNGTGIISIAIDFSANGPHVYLKRLAYSMTRRRSSTSWLRIDSQIVWVPSRTAAQSVAGAVSATVTGYRTIALSGSGGDVRIHLSGKKLGELVREINALPLGPTNQCMESLTGFQMTITLKNGERLLVVNGFCGGASESVSSPSGNLNDVRYVLSDHSCTFIRSVASLFTANSAPGTRQALRQCLTWSKSSAS
jgi:hypothetical protein